MDSTSKGTGKPEQLKHKLTILWSRRLTQTDRLIYKFDDTSIYIFTIGGITPLADYTYTLGTGAKR